MDQERGRTAVDCARMADEEPEGARVELEADSVPGSSAVTRPLGHEHRPGRGQADDRAVEQQRAETREVYGGREKTAGRQTVAEIDPGRDRKSTRLNSSHL